MRAAASLKFPHCISRDFEQEATTQCFLLRGICCDLFVSRFLVTFKSYLRKEPSRLQWAVYHIVALAAFSELFFFLFWYGITDRWVESLLTENRLTWAQFVDLFRNLERGGNHPASDDSFWPTIIFIIFWGFLMFYQIFLSPQVRRCAFITCKHGTYELPYAWNYNTNRNNMQKNLLYVQISLQVAYCWKC